MKKYLITAMLLVIGGASVAFLTTNNVEAATNYTLANVQAHNTSTNCWLINKNKVYNLTNFISSHPGGSSAIIALCGKDATAAFSAQHNGSKFANSVLNSNYIGNLVAADIISPTTPTNLSAQAKTNSKIRLTWTASTDNIAVTGYKIYRNGSFIANVKTLSFDNIGLTASTSYQYNIAAYDANGNLSDKTATVTIATLATSTPSNGTTTPPVVKRHENNGNHYGWDKQKDKKDKNEKYRNKEARELEKSDRKDRNDRDNDDNDDDDEDDEDRD